MLVFISWSGETSRYVAEQLRAWLKDVMQRVEPWVSSEDVRQGARWNVDVARKLEEATFGILCLTRDNFNQPWLVFEAGALAKTLDQANVCPYLINLKPTEVSGPLVQFQAATATEEGTRRLVHSINKALGENSLPDEQIDRACRKWWPDLKSTLDRAPQARTTLPDLRSERELLEEMLGRVRRIDARAEVSELMLENAVAAFDYPRDLFQGRDVTALLTKLNKLGQQDDRNASVWSRSHLNFDANELDGLWATRWGGGIAHDDWVAGVARVQVYGACFYALTHDGRADCIIAAKRVDNNRLAGRYINLGAPSEVLAWAGRIVDPNRIDGFWTQGRWDLRRGEEFDQD